jgi:hypothetical protein
MERNHRRTANWVLNGATEYWLRGTTGDAAIKTGRNDRNANLTVHRGLVNCTENDLGFLAHGFVNYLVDLMDFTEREILAARDVDEYAGRAGDRDVVEQRAGNRLLRSLDRAIFTAADSGTHKG